MLHDFVDNDSGSKCEGGICRNIHQDSVVGFVTQATEMVEFEDGL